jgi:hypothetical protein
MAAVGTNCSTVPQEATTLLDQIEQARGELC